MKANLLNILIITVILSFQLTCVVQNQDLPSIDAKPKDLPPLPIRHLRSPKEFRNLSQADGSSLVILYEQWCGYSQMTLNLMEQLSRNQDFLRTKVQHILYIGSCHRFYRKYMFYFGDVK